MSADPAYRMAEFSIFLRLSPNCKISQSKTRESVLFSHKTSRIKLQPSERLFQPIGRCLTRSPSASEDVTLGKKSYFATFTCQKGPVYDKTLTGLGRNLHRQGVEFDKAIAQRCTVAAAPPGLPAERLGGIKRGVADQSRLAPFIWFS